MKRRGKMSAVKDDNMRSFTSVHVRWCVRKDHSEVVRIERASFSSPWRKKDFEDTLALPNVVGLVAEHDDHVVGYVVYELLPHAFRILNFAVDPEFRRAGVGTQIMSRMIEKLGQKRERIEILARESNTGAQLFLKALGFRALSIVKKPYDDSTDDAFLMEYRNDWSADGLAVIKSIWEGEGKVVR